MARNNKLKSEGGQMGIGILAVFVISLIYKGRKIWKKRGEIIIDRMRNYKRLKIFK